MRGTSLVLLLFLISAIFHYSRWARSEKDELPAVVRLSPQLKKIVVVDDSGKYGLYQFNDGSTIADVIKVTNEGLGRDFHLEGKNEQPLVSGQSIKIDKLGTDIQIDLSWLSARQRILLEIPLHPDRMNVSDWEALPGIGPSLAHAIELDRQINGDFVKVGALKRVKGLGSKKIEALQGYFER